MSENGIKEVAEIHKIFATGASKNIHTALAGFMSTIPPIALVIITWIVKDKISEITIDLILLTIVLYMFALLMMQRQSKEKEPTEYDKIHTQTFINIDRSIKEMRSDIETSINNFNKDINHLSEIVLNASAHLSFSKLLEHPYTPEEFPKFWSRIIASSMSSIRAINGICAERLMGNGALEETLKIFAAHNVQLKPFESSVSMERIFIVKDKEDCMTFREAFKLHLKYGVQFHILFAQESIELLKKQLSWPLQETFMICDDSIIATFRLNEAGHVQDIWPRTDKNAWNELDHRYKAIKNAAIQYHAIPNKIPELRDIFSNAWDSDSQ